MGRASRAANPRRIEADLDAFCIQCARVVGVSTSLVLGQRVRTRVVRHGMWSGSLECARERAQTRAAKGMRLVCACYSSRFLSPRNALAIIAART